MRQALKYLTIMTCAAGLILSGGLAHAQEEPQLPGTTSSPFATSYGVSGTSYSLIWVALGTSPLTTTGVIVAIVLMSSRKQSPKALQMYLNTERVAVLEAVSTGSGEGLTDLATLFQVSPQNHAQFARLLRSHRGELVPLLLGEEISAEQTYEFARIIIDRMREHDALRLDIERAIQRALEAEAQG